MTRAVDPPSTTTLDEIVVAAVTVGAPQPQLFRHDETRTLWYQPQYSQSTTIIGCLGQEALLVSSRMPIEW
jgi:hypothetical protein